MTYDGFFSHAAAQMRESAIRKMGTLGTRIPDLISFAPGYPDPATFPWERFRAITVIPARATVKFKSGKIMRQKVAKLSAVMKREAEKVA